MVCCNRYWKFGTPLGLWLMPHGVAFVVTTVIKMYSQNARAINPLLIRTGGRVPKLILTWHCLWVPTHPNAPINENCTVKRVAIRTSKSILQPQLQPLRLRILKAILPSAICVNQDNIPTIPTRSPPSPTSLAIPPAMICTTWAWAKTFPRHCAFLFRIFWKCLAVALSLRLHQTQF